MTWRAMYARSYPSGLRRSHTVGAALDYTHAHSHLPGGGGGGGGLQVLQPLQYPVGAYTRPLFSST